MRTTLRAKLIGGVAVVAALLGVQAFVTVGRAESAASEMRHAQHAGVDAALLGKRIQFDIVQVQQWLTDISATRGLDGLDDGMDVAAEFAADFEVAVSELQTIRPELTDQLADITTIFADYYATGQTMARAYVAGGPAEGNMMMSSFDAAAAEMGEAIDALVDDLLTQSEESLEAAINSAEGVGLTVVVASGLIILLAIGSGVVFAGRLSRPITMLAARAREVAEGHIDGEPLAIDRSDEIGDLAQVFNTMVAALQEMVTQLRTSSEQLGGAAEGLTEVSASMGSSAETTSSQATSASATGDQVSANVGSVATAIEQLNESIREVAHNAAEASSVSTEAVEVARQTSNTIEKLGESSVEIGNVIQVINSIAEQTNLLALNATIEAARAGEAGKGFAVVANEVKELANQTAKATEDISQRIQAIQADTNGAVAANEEIGATIDRINEISSAIASAVEEQSVTTAQIGRSIEEAAAGTQQIAAVIGEVATAAKDTRDSTAQTRNSADEMARMADGLGRLVAQYT